MESFKRLCQNLYPAGSGSAVAQKVDLSVVVVVVAVVANNNQSFISSLYKNIYIYSFTMPARNLANAHSMSSLQFDGFVKTIVTVQIWVHSHQIGLAFCYC